MSSYDTYPDGKPIPTRPRGGEQYVVTDGSLKNTTWVFDANFGKWFIVASGAQLRWPHAAPDHFYASVARKCECGAEKLGSPGHSTWCPKDEK